MSIRLSFLNDHDISEIQETFVGAFSDYQIDMSYMTEERQRDRAIKNGVNFNYSVGAFENGKMVGFILVGIDNWNGAIAAFDAGTGIVPAHRGKGLTGKMFEYTIPKLVDAGVKKFLLEVLQENKAGIKAYEKAGFNINRELECYRQNVCDLKLPEAHIPYTIKPIKKEDLHHVKTFADWQPSWENSFSSIARINDELTIYGAFTGDICVGFIVYYPFFKWILNLAVQKNYRKKGVATILLKHLTENLTPDTATIDINNIDASDTGMLNFVKSRGFDLYVKQYEMELDF